MKIKHFGILAASSLAACGFVFSLPALADTFADPNGWQEANPDSATSNGWGPWQKLSSAQEMAIMDAVESPDRLSAENFARACRNQRGALWGRWAEVEFRKENEGHDGIKLGCWNEQGGDWAKTQTPRGPANLYTVFGRRQEATF